MVFSFGDGLLHSKPQGLRWRAAIGPLSGSGGPEMVDITDWVDHLTMAISRNADTEASTASFDFLQELGNFYDIKPQGAIWVDDTDDADFTGRYHRYFAGFIDSPSATSENGAEWRDIHVECVDNNVLLHRPPRSIGIQWPPGDGTPVVATVLRQSITPDVVSTVVPESMHEIYATKWLVMADANGDNLERFQVSSVNYTGNTTVAAAVARSAIGTSVTVTPASMTGISTGLKLYVFNKGGKNDETITVTGTTATTFTAVLNKKKEANWIIMAGEFTATLKLPKTYTQTTVAAAISPGLDVVITPASMTGIEVGQLLTVHNRTDLYTSSTTVAVGFAHPELGENPAQQTVTPASMTGIQAGMRLYAQNSDDTDGENVTVESITGSTFTATFGKPKKASWQVKSPTDRVHNWEKVVVKTVNTPAGTFTADFTTSKFANWHIEIIPTLSGGLPVRELIADGWQQEVDGIMTAVDSLIDMCYTNATPSFLVSADGVDDFHDSVLPHLKWECATPADVINDVKPYLTGDYETIVDAAMTTTGSLQWVTPRNMFGIEVGKEIVVQNAAGTNREVVEVVDRDTVRFQAIFTSTKSAGWYVLSRSEMRGYMAVISDSPDHSALWTPLMVIYDAANQDLTTLSIDDEGDGGVTSVSFTDYTLERHGRNQVTSAMVYNPDTGAYGEYHDTDLINDLGRSICISIKSSKYLTSAACTSAAREHVQRERVVPENVHITLYQQISRHLFQQARRVRFKARAEGTTQPDGKIYPLIRITARFDQNGVVRYELECGPPIPEMGSPTPYELTGGKPPPYKWVLEPVRVTQGEVRPYVTGKGYVADTSGGSTYINLPRAADVPGFVIGAVKTTNDTNRVVYQPQDTETIGGRHEVALERQNESAVLQSDGEEWQEIANAGFRGITTRHDIETVAGRLHWTNAKNQIEVTTYANESSPSFPSVVEDLTNDGTRKVEREWFWNIATSDQGNLSLNRWGFSLQAALSMYAQVPINVNSTANDVSSIYLMDCTAGNRTLTLPTISERFTRVYIIGKYDTSANTLTIDPDGSETIDGAATKVLTQQSTIILYGSTAGWRTLLMGTGANATTSEYGLEYGIPDSGAVISGINRMQVVVPDTGKITGWEMISSLSGSITVNVIHYTYAGYTGSPTTLFSPALSSANKTQGSGLTNAVTKGDVIRFEVSGTPSTVQDLTLTLHVERGV
jgi:hypothetical protein